MTRNRKWVTLLAVVGVLLHAGLVTRHATAMVQTRLLHQAIVADLAIICHSDGTIGSRAGIVDLPLPGQSEETCPICLGQISATALLPTPICVPQPIPTASARVLVLAEVIAPRLTRLRPPTRGPPTIA